MSAILRNEEKVERIRKGKSGKVTTCGTGRIISGVSAYCVTQVE